MKTHTALYQLVIRKHMVALAVGIALPGIFSSAAHAALDTFSGYANESNLNTASGGSSSGNLGWTGNWTQSGGSQVSVLSALTLNCSGTAGPAVEGNVANGFFEYTRSFTEVANNQGKIYVKVNMAAGASTGGVFAGFSYGGIGLYKNTTEKFLIGARYNQSVWGVTSANALNGAGANSTTAIGAYQCALLVAVINQSNNTIQLYINPDLTRPESENTPATVAMNYGSNDDSVNTLRLRGGGGQNKWQYDDVEIRTTWPTVLARPYPPAVMEDFDDYAHNANLSAAAGGLNTTAAFVWTNAWSAIGASQPVVVSTNATACAGTSVPFALGDASPGSFDYARSFTAAGNNSGTYYIHATIAAGRADGGSFAASSYGGIGLYRGTTEKFLIGARFNRTNWGITAASALNSLAGGDSTTAIGAFQCATLVAKVNQSDNTITLYVNPDLRLDEGANTPAVSPINYGSNDDSFDTVRLRGGGGALGARNLWRFDAVHISTAWPRSAPVVEANCGSVDIVWLPVEGASFYSLYRKTGDDEYGSALVTGLSTTNYQDTSATNAALSYTYAVAAVNSSGAGNRSADSLSVSPLEGPSITAQPTNATINTSAATPQPVFVVSADGDAPLSYQWRKGTWNQAWSFTGNAQGLGNSRLNAGGSSGGINSTNGSAWKLATSTGTVDALRSFPLPEGLQTGELFQIDMDNGWLNSGSQEGFQLLNPAGEVLFGFYFQGGQSFYTIDAGSVSPASNIPFTGHGLRVALTLTSASTYSLTVTHNTPGVSSFTAGGATYGPFTGNLHNPAGGQSMTQVRLYMSENPGLFANSDLYFNHIVAGSFTDQAGAYATWAGDQSGTALVNNERFLGVNTSTLLLQNPLTNDAGYYGCVVTNTCGAVSSSLAYLTVNEVEDSLTISGQPAGDLICQDNTLSVVATGTEPIRYAWRRLDAGWSTGSGAAGWSLTDGGGGFFVGTSTNNGAGSKGIDTEGLSWGLYNDGGDQTVAARTFGALRAGDIFQIDMDNGYIRSGASVGLRLQNANGTDLMRFSFTGGGSSYSLEASGISPTPSIPYTKDGLRLRFQVVSSTTFALTVTSLGTGTNYGPYAGTFLASGPIARLALFNANANGGLGSNYDLFFNNLFIGPRLTLPFYTDEASFYASWSDGDNYGSSVVSGANNATLTTSIPGSYDVLVYNDCCDLISSNATLTACYVASVQIQPDELSFNATPGQTYDWYFTGDDPSGSVNWSSGGSVTPQNSQGQISISESDRVYYQVVLDGLSPSASEGDVWGIIKPFIPPGYSMFSPPLPMTDLSFTGQLGQALGAVLTPGIKDQGDTISIRANNSWSKLYLDASRQWRHYANDALVTDFALDPGQGMYINHQGAGARPRFTGAVGSLVDTPVTAAAGDWNIVGVSGGQNRTIQQLQFSGGTPKSGTRISANDADIISVEVDGVWRTFFRLNNTWVDTAPQGGTLVIEPGQALFYYRQSSAGTLNMAF